MPRAFRSMTMTGKVMTFISNTIKGEGRPGVRKRMELFQACIEKDREMQGLSPLKNGFVPWLVWLSGLSNGLWTKRSLV